MTQAAITILATGTIRGPLVQLSDDEIHERVTRIRHIEHRAGGDDGSASGSYRRPTVAEVRERWSEAFDPCEQ